MEIERMCFRLLAMAGIAVGQATAAGYAVNGDAVLGELIAEVIERNPGIKSAAADHAAAEETIIQAGALPAPMVSLTGHALAPQTRVGPQLAGVTVTQNVPWFGERGDRREAAGRQASADRELLRVRRADAVRAVKTAYYEIGYLDAAIGIAAEEEELLRHYESLARARYAEGAASQQAVLKLQAAITQVRYRRRGLRGDRVAMVAELNALRDRPVRQRFAPVALRDPDAVPVDDDALRILEALGRERAPEVLIAVHAMRRAEVGIRIAQRRYRPELALTGSWGVVAERGDGPGRLNPPPGNGDDTFSVGIGLRVPIYRGALAAGVREAEARFAAAQHEHRSALNRLALAVRGAGARLAATDQQIELYRSALLPQAEQALAASEAAYATGVIGVQELLAGERELLEARLGLARLRADYMKLLAGMERAVGAAFPPGSES